MPSPPEESGGGGREVKDRNAVQSNGKLLPLYVYIGRHCFHEETNKARPLGALTVREATGLLLNKKAFLQQDIAPVGSHLALCNESQRGTSSYQVSTNRAATTASRSRNRKTHLGRVRMWGSENARAPKGGEQLNHLCSGHFGESWQHCLFKLNLLG